MRFCLISDVHADTTLFGVSRFAEVERAMLKSVEVAIARKCDHYLFLGDLCDPDSGTSVFRCVRLAIEVAVRLFNVGIPSTWIAGNHDVIEDGSGETSLTPLRGVGTLVMEAPGWLSLTSDLMLLALPFTAASHTYDPAEFIRKNWAANSKVVVATHLGIEGVQPGEETTDMPRGRDVLYPTELIATKGSRVVAQFAGHYHKRQTYRGIQVVGAPARYAFGERDNEPGFLIVEV